MVSRMDEPQTSLSDRSQTPNVLGGVCLYKAQKEDEPDSEGRGSLVCCCPWGSQRVGLDLATE